jgi:hypothetical protein
MLRKVLLWCGALLLAGGAAVCLATVSLLGLGPVVIGLMLLLALVFERRGYQPIADSVPGPDWQRTGEAFVDPGSGAEVTVYFQPRTGKRVYVRTRRNT